MDLKQLCHIAIEAAKAAGEIIQEYMDKDLSIETKVAGESLQSQVVTEADTKCEAAILSYLLPTCSTLNLGLLTEESEDDLSRFEKDYFWCIDPLDGTLPFINQQPGFSVSIALVAKDGTPVVGVVFDPSTDNLYHAIKGQGAFKNNADWEVKCSNDHLSYVTDRTLKETKNASEIEKILQEKVKALGLKEVVEIAGGGAVMNAITVLRNGPALMLKMPKPENGGGSIWDYAATACIFHEVGKKATAFNGDHLDLNKKETTFMNLGGIYYENLSS